MGDSYEAYCDDLRNQRNRFGATVYEAFLTGSVVYGDPHREGASGDIDLVVLIDHDELDFMVEYADEVLFNEYNTTCNSYPMQFGALNLLACTSKDVYDVWKKGTEQLKQASPVTRDHACEVFNNLRATTTMKGR